MKAHSLKSHYSPCVVFYRAARCLLIRVVIHGIFQCRRYCEELATKQSNIDHPIAVLKIRAMELHRLKYFHPQSFCDVAGLGSPQ